MTTETSGVADAGTNVGAIARTLIVTKCMDAFSQYHYPKGEEAPVCSDAGGW
jgi:hypothetical protein